VLGFAGVRGWYKRVREAVIHYLGGLHPQLATNAIKYGALSIPSGRLRVEWSCEETHLVIRWSERDGPPVKPPQRQGFGTRVVDRVIQELKGKLRFEWDPKGVVCEMAIPVDQLADNS
jgi:two-component sensor histidine kinase